MNRNILRNCDNCYKKSIELQMKKIDVSKESDYYPTFEYICPDCQKEFGGLND